MVAANVTTSKLSSSTLVPEDTVKDFLAPFLECFGKFFEQFESRSDDYLLALIPQSIIDRVLSVFSFGNCAGSKCSEKGFFSDSSSQDQCSDLRLFDKYPEREKEKALVTSERIGLENPASVTCFRKHLGTEANFKNVPPFRCIDLEQIVKNCLAEKCHLFLNTAIKKMEADDKFKAQLRLDCSQDKIILSIDPQVLRNTRCMPKFAL